MNVFKDGMYYYGFDYLAKYLEAHPASAKEKKILRQLFRLVSHLNPLNSIEIANDLSTVTLALALPCKKNNITIFTNTKTDSTDFPKNIALQHKKNITTFLQTTDKLDFTLIHADDNLETYIKQITPYLHSDSCIVIHKPYHNKSDWENIVKSNQFNVSIDLYSLGVLFPKYSQTSEHFVLRS